MTHTLTAKEARVLDAIAEFVAEHGYSPTIRDVAKAIGKVPSTAAYHLLNLERAGLVASTPGTARSLRLVTS